MAALAMRDPDTTTCRYLRERVIHLSEAQRNIMNPAPLLKATEVVLTGQAPHRGQVPARNVMSEWECAVWGILDELDACYQRDKPEIETAHKVMSDAGMLPGVDQ